MNYTLSEKNIKTVIAGNVETLSNSKIEILMGTNINEQFTDDQYVTFITQAAQMYDFVFLDSSLPELKQAVIDYSDMVFCFVNPSQKQLRKLKKYYWKVLNEEKTEVILNKYEKGVMGRSEIAKILEKKPKHVVSYDKKVLHAANSGDLNLGETKANDDLAAIADYLIDRYGLRKKKWYETLFKIPSLKNKEALDVKPTE